MKTESSPLDLRDAIARLFTYEDGTDYHFGSVKITHYQDGSVRIEVSQMYEDDRPKMRHSLLETLQSISQITGLPEVDDEEVNVRGCDTCDYDSRYGFAFRAYRTPNQGE